LRRLREPIDEFGLTILHVYARTGKVNLLFLLLQSGASVDVLDDFGQTPLDAAQDAGQQDAVRVLKAFAGDWVHISHKDVEDLRRHLVLQARITGEE